MTARRRFRALLASALDHVFFLRPLLLAPAAAMAVMGRDAARGAIAAASSAAPGAEGAARELAAASAREPLAFAALACALLATHAANQLSDEASDRANGKLPHLALGLVSRDAAKRMTALLVALACALLALAPRAQWPLLAGSLALGIAYTAPPLTLKRRAGWDLAANALGYGGLAFAIGWGSIAPPDRATAAQAAPWILAVGAVFAATAVVDARGDAAAGARTLAVALGASRARWLAVALMAAAAGAAWLAGARTALLLALGSIPAMIAASVRPSPRADHLAFQIGAALPAVAAAMLAPLFGVALVAAGVVSRIYFRARLGRGYPHVGAPSPREAAPRESDRERSEGQSLGRRTTLADSPGSIR